MCLHLLGGSFSQESARPPQTHFINDAGYGCKLKWDNNRVCQALRKLSCSGSLPSYDKGWDPNNLFLQKHIYVDTFREDKEVQCMQPNSALCYKTEMALENVSLTQQFLFLTWPVALSCALRLITVNKAVDVELQLLQLPHHTPPWSSPDWCGLRKPPFSAQPIPSAYKYLSWRLKVPPNLLLWS